MTQEKHAILDSATPRPSAWVECSLGPSEARPVAVVDRGRYSVAVQSGSCAPEPPIQDRAMPPTARTAPADRRWKSGGASQSNRLRLEHRTYARCHGRQTSAGMPALPSREAPSAPVPHGPFPAGRDSQGISQDTTAFYASVSVRPGFQGKLKRGWQQCGLRGFAGAQPLHLERCGVLPG